MRRPPHTEWLKQEKYIVSQSWRPKVRDEAVSRPMKALGKALSQVFRASGSLACHAIIPVSRGVLPVCMSVFVSKFFLFIVLLDERPTLLHDDLILANHVYSGVRCYQRVTSYSDSRFSFMKLLEQYRSTRLLNLTN